MYNQAGFGTYMDILFCLEACSSRKVMCTSLKQMFFSQSMTATELDAV